MVLTQRAIIFLQQTNGSNQIMLDSMYENFRSFRHQSTNYKIVYVIKDVYHTSSQVFQRLKKLISIYSLT